MASECLFRLCVEAETTRFTPALIAGDYNHCLQELDADWAFGVSGWTDIGTQPTSNAAAQPWRIDLCVASRAMQDRVVDYSLHWATGIRTHAAQTLTLRAGKMPQILVWNPAPPLAQPAGDGPSRTQAVTQLTDRFVEVERLAELEDADATWAQCAG